MKLFIRIILVSYSEITTYAFYYIGCNRFKKTNYEIKLLAVIFNFKNKVHFLLFYRNILSESKQLRATQEMGLMKDKQ